MLVSFLKIFLLLLFKFHYLSYATKAVLLEVILHRDLPP